MHCLKYLQFSFVSQMMCEVPGQCKAAISLLPEILLLWSSGSNVFHFIHSDYYWVLCQNSKFSVSGENEPNVCNSVPVRPVVLLVVYRVIKAA